MAPLANIAGKALGVLDPSKSTGKTLMVLNALGIAFAALSNTFAAATDKNTSAEDKKFLVPAGGATGIANVAIYFGMTKKLIDKLSGTAKHEGKGLADKVINTMVSKGTFDKNADTFIASTIAKAVKKGKNTGYIESMQNTLKNADGTLTDAARNLYKSHIKDGFGVLGAFAGAVIGCAIITPILRDVSAYFVQKAREAKNPSLKDKPYRPYFDISHIRAGKYPYGKPNNQPLSMTSYMNFTNGRTRV